MARKKQEFDPLAGLIGGSGLRKKKSKGKSFDVLGGGFGGDHPVEKEAFDSYADVSFGGSSDALMETGGGSSPRSKPGKKGLFASIFGGGGKKKQQKPQRESMPLEAEEERPESYVPKHVRDPELEIQDGVMETGIADRMVDPAYDEYGEPEYREQYEEPVPHHQSAGEPEEDLFEEEEVAPPPVRKPAERKTMPVSVPVRTVAAFLCWSSGVSGSVSCRRRTGYACVSSVRCGVSDRASAVRFRVRGVCAAVPDLLPGGDDADKVP